MVAVAGQEADHIPPVAAASRAKAGPDSMEPEARAVLQVPQVRQVRRRLVPRSQRRAGLAAEGSVRADCLVSTAKPGKAGQEALQGLR